MRLLALTIVVVGFFLETVGTLHAQLIGKCPKIKPEKLLVVRQVRGEITDEALGLIPALEIKLVKKVRHSFEDFLTATSDRNGRFDFGAVPPGMYRLLAAGHGRYASLCEQSLSIKVTETGWNGFRIKLPVHHSDSCPGDCNATVEKLKE